ncbi:MAG: DUF86 domain-containing protein [Bacilli bacterium]
MWNGLLIQIIKRCNRISKKLENITQETFINDDDLNEVICFNLFQIGELSNGLSEDFINEHSTIPWKQIIGMRNRIVHGYDTINNEIVWNTALENIPMLCQFCKNLLDNNK